ncbi:hypothetical protein TcWFU_006090 [Taenia crassiceps]|uniref:Ashwin n=1 Tax=Taenia crassiceps TaxID=6207 RepID=A0ABR4Q8C5_9CEST
MTLKTRVLDFVFDGMLSTCILRANLGVFRHNFTYFAHSRPNIQTANVMNGDSAEDMSGFYEVIPEDGSIVDLTQPGLFSRRQLVAIFRRRGFDRLLSTIHPDTNSLIRAYYDHIIPLPCRNRTKSSILSKNRSLDHGHKVISSATQRLRQELDPPPTSLNREKRQQSDLDKLIIISNPNWPTSGVTPTPQKSAVTPEETTKCSNHLKRSPTSSPPPSVSSRPPLKRPKINRNFANLEPLECNWKRST